MYKGHDVTVITKDSIHVQKSILRNEQRILKCMDMLEKLEGYYENTEELQSWRDELDRRMANREKLYKAGKEWRG